MGVDPRSHPDLPRAQLLVLAQGQLAAGDDDSTTRQPFRSLWAVANLATGLLTILVASSHAVGG